MCFGFTTQDIIQHQQHSGEIFWLLCFSFVSDHHLTDQFLYPILAPVLLNILVGHNVLPRPAEAGGWDHKNVFELWFVVFDEVHY